MKIKSFLSKLSKLGITPSTFAYNDLNKCFHFFLNGYKIEADFDEGKPNIGSIAAIFERDELTQERRRFFFTSFDHMLRFTKVA